MADSSSSEYDLAPPPSGSPSSKRPPSSKSADEGSAPPSQSSGPRQPPKPLPRLSRTAPPAEETDAEAPRPTGSGAPRTSRRDRNAERLARRKGAAVEEDDEPGTRTLATPTPTLDTVETRGRVRLILGIMAFVAVGLAIAMIVRAVGGGGSDMSDVYVIDSTQMFGPPTVNARDALPTTDPNDAEEAAQGLLGRARTALTIQLAHSYLQRIVDSYPDTQTAATAREALERIANRQPPFPDIPSLAPEVIVLAPAPEPAPDTVADRIVAPPPQPQPEPEPAPELVVRVLPNGFSPASGAEEDSSGWPSRIVCERDGMTMVLVPGGVYIMGRDGGPPSEGPAHRVELPPFYLDEHEVTVEQFARYRDALTQRGETVLPKPEELTRLGLTPRHPVVLTSAQEALRYAEWAGKSLPTEAQWEAAARGPEGLIRPWGAAPPPWPRQRTNRSIEPVRAYPADRSAAGLFDMAANAWEWTADWFEGGAYGDRARFVAYNPGGPDRPSSQPPRQTVRGSSPSHDLTYREGMPITTRLPYLGFRCALNVEGLPVAGAGPRLIQAPSSYTPGVPPTVPARPPQPQPPRPQPPANTGTLVPF
ncbi:formylglycine-generating enzyme family protein [Tautonia rosea]|uniref:formylglycine-generating enzyme family protein n=1 Tax=Tautonia rosea TaxID=2728037 RepID=UPI00147665BB|nr:SUMF1/EgtB/PvdO family nonheme iron enzyme [Tautonia rosea]